jgi:hypothetical protein
MGVVEPLHYPYLSAYGLLALQIFHFLFEVDFESHFSIISSVSSEVNYGIGTRADLFTKSVIFHRVVIRVYNHLFIWIWLWHRLRQNYRSYLLWRSFRYLLLHLGLAS